MKLFDIFILPDSVEILSQTIRRPNYVGVVEWMEFWEDVILMAEKEKVDESKEERAER